MGLAVCFDGNTLANENLREDGDRSTFNGGKVGIVSASDYWRKFEFSPQTGEGALNVSFLLMAVRPLSDEGLRINAFSHKLDARRV